MSEPLQPELADYQRQFQANREEAAALCNGLTAAQFNWRPGPGRWSIGECFEHLNVSADLFARQIEVAAQRGRARGKLGTGPFRYGAVGRWFVRALEPPVRARYKTPSKFHPRPASAIDRDATLRRFEQAGHRWDECLQRCNGLDLARVRVRSPALGLLRLQLGAQLASQAAHERRHLWQARQVLEHADFPAD